MPIPTTPVPIRDRSAGDTGQGGWLAQDGRRNSCRLQAQALDGFPAATLVEPDSIIAGRNPGVRVAKCGRGLLESEEKEASNAEVACVFRDHHAKNPRGAARSFDRADLIIDRPESNDANGGGVVVNGYQGHRESYTVAGLFARYIDEPGRVLLSVSPLIPSENAHLFEESGMRGELINLKVR